MSVVVVVAVGLIVAVQEAQRLLAVCLPGTRGEEPVEQVVHLAPTLVGAPSSLGRAVAHRARQTLAVTLRRRRRVRVAMSISLVVSVGVGLLVAVFVLCVGLCVRVCVRVGVRVSVAMSVAVAAVGGWGVGNLGGEGVRGCEQWAECLRCGSKGRSQWHFKRRSDARGARVLFKRRLRLRQG